MFSLSGDVFLFLLIQFMMVRLLTHNLLACHAKGCTSNNFPLQLKDVQTELRDAEFNPDFIRGFLPRLEWKALVDAARQVSTMLAIFCYEDTKIQN